MRNIIALAAVALTSVLFTSVFTLGSSIISAIQEQTMRQVGTSAHGGLKYLTEEQYEHFASSPLIKDISFDIIAAVAENAELGEIYSEIRYSQDKMARWSFSYPTTGAMPQTDRELACSTIVLDALGVPHEPGAPVPLEFTVGEKRFSGTFTLCGFWEGDSIAPAQQIWLSRSYVEKLFADRPAGAGDIFGTIGAGVMFADSFDIEGKMQRLLAERGYTEEEIDTGVNWAYAASEVDPSMIGIASFVLALVLLSGYLIIHSVFAISVNADIRFYGLLKTIGTTGRQIRGIVNRQAAALSAAGIPAGLAAGYMTGVLAAPVALRMTTVPSGGSAPGVNPLIFLFSALFSLLTVFVSCRRPAAAAAKVSPVEAAKYSGGNTGSSRKTKRTGTFTPLAFALANVTREKRKLCVIVLSLSLSMVLLNSVFSAVRSFDIDEYLSRSIISDFAVADASVYQTGADSKNLEGVSDEFLALAKEHGAARISNIYCRETFGDRWIQVYGVGRKELEYVTGIGYDALRSGNYAIVSRQVLSVRGLSAPDVGDTVTLTNDAGESRSFEVIGSVGEYPSHLSSRSTYGDGIEVILADEVFLGFYGGSQPMQSDIEVPDDRIEEFEDWLENYTALSEPNLAFRSRSTFRAEFEGLRTTYLALGGSLAFILALIGVLNFTNTAVTSVFARRREFAMLQSVGMTERQLRRTLMLEGACYTALAGIFTLTIGFALTWAVTRLIAGQVWFFKQSVTLLPSAACLPVLLALSAAIPVISCARMARESVVDRLRVE